MIELLIAIPVSLALMGTGIAVEASRRHMQGWCDAATAGGLRVVRHTRPLVYRSKLEAEAEDGTLRLRIEDYYRRREVGTRVMISVPGPPGFQGLRIRGESFYRPTSREIEIGDPGFDRVFSIEGPRRLAAVLLDRETRERLTSLAQRGLRVGVVNGEIVVEMVDASVPILLPELLGLARRLAEPVDVARRLADNAREDSQPGVRLLGVSLLARDFAGDPQTVETLRQACLDQSPQVRLQAARGLGDEGLDVLRDLAEGLAHDDVSAQAVSALGRRLPFERARDLLSTALHRRFLKTARACLVSLVEGGHPVAVDVLTRVLTHEQGELAAAAALALGETGSPEAEPPLIRALRSGRTDLRAAAAKALGRVGSALAVPPLKEAAENLSWDPELRQAARQSVAEIQSRLPGATPGQLSLAGDEAGQLSLAEAEAGQLSLSEEPQRPERISG